FDRFREFVPWPGIFGDRGLGDIIAGRQLRLPSRLIVAVPGAVKVEEIHIEKAEALAAGHIAELERADGIADGNLFPWLLAHRMTDRFWEQGEPLDHIVRQSESPNRIYQRLAHDRAPPDTSSVAARQQLFDAHNAQLVDTPQA